MARFTLLHAAELPLDTPFTGIGHQVLYLTGYPWTRDLLVAVGGATRVVEL